MTNYDNWFPDPYTNEGVAFATHASPMIRLYEAGALKLDASWNYQEICSPYWRAYYNLESGAAIEVAGTRVPLGPDRVVLIPEGLVYNCLPQENVRHTWIHFQLPVPLPPETVLTVKPVSECFSLWKKAWPELAERKNSRVILQRMTAVLALVMSELPEEYGRSMDPRFKAFYDWIELRLDRPPSVDEMAKQIRMERRTFLRWFRRETGETPSDFLTRLRMHEACRMLRFSNSSIDQIATAVGYTDRHHFSRVFKSRVGMSPATWRRSQLGY